MMRILFLSTIIAATIILGDAYSKYGRTCRDIGCVSNEVCVMKEDPCTVYSRKNCGKYPTCQRVSNAARTCANYVCPPSTTCRMDRSVPKCFADSVSSGSKRPVPSYNPRGSPGASMYPSNYPQNPGYNSNNLQYQTTSRPNVYQLGQRVSGGGYQGGVIGSGYPGQGGYPRQNSGGYPGQAYPRPAYSGQYYAGAGQTTSRPNVYQPGQRVVGGGYQGEVIGSGYPGQGGYPTQQGGYPGTSARQAYPGYTYSNGGYPRQGGGYPNQGYHAQYNQNHGGYGYNQQTEQVSPNPLLDKISQSLGNWASNFFRL